jgi:hypothetical protein
MKLFLKVLGVSLCVVFGLSQKDALGCCGNEVSYTKAPDPLRWTPSFEVALKYASDLKMPLMVLFTTRELAQTAGEGLTFRKEYEATSGKHPDMTLIDYEQGIDSIQRSGVRIFVKLAETDANKEIFKKYHAKPSMVVFIAPDGEKLGSYKGSDTTPIKLIPALDKFVENMDEWRRKHGIAVAEKK